MESKGLRSCVWTVLDADASVGDAVAVDGVWLRRFLMDAAVG